MLKAKIIQPIKFLMIFALIFLFLVTGFIVSLFYFNRWKLKSVLNRICQGYAKLGLFVLGVEVRTLGEMPQTNALVISNHLSYVDVLIMASKIPTCFVTSMEIRQTPFLGTLTEMGGCLYVERRNKTNISNEIKDITQALQKGLFVTIYPEATSTNGQEVIRFRSPLYNASTLSGKCIQTSCLNYTSLDGEPITSRNRDDVFWYGDMGFVSHLWRLCGRQQLVAELKFLNRLEAKGPYNPLFLAQNSHAIVSSEYVPIT